MISEVPKSQYNTLSSLKEKYYTNVINKYVVIIAKCLLPDGAYQLLLNWKAHIHNSKVGCFLRLIILERSQVPLELIKLFHIMMSYISVSVDSLI